MAFEPWGSGSPALLARKVPGTLSSGQGLQSASSTCPQSLVTLSPPLPLISPPDHLMQSAMAASAATKALSATSLLRSPTLLIPYTKTTVGRDRQALHTQVAAWGGGRGLDGGKT